MSGGRSASFAVIGRMQSATPTLRFDDLGKFLLHKNGNYLYKVPFQGREAVLKVYYGSLSMARYALKSAGNVLLANQSAVMPWSRRRTELDCIRLWGEAGFRVFGVYDAVVEGLPRRGLRAVRVGRRAALRQLLRGPLACRSRRGSRPGGASCPSGTGATGSRSTGASRASCTRTAT